MSVVGVTAHRIRKVLPLASARLTKREATAKSYGDYLRQLVAEWHGVDPAAWSVGMWEAVVRAKRALSAARAAATERGGVPRGWSIRTVQIVASGARGWIAHAKDRGLPLADFMGEWKAPHQPRRKVKGAPLAALRALLTAAKGTRYEAPIALAACAGLRRAEFVGLDVADVDRTVGRITVRSAKGRPDRIVPIPPMLDEVFGRVLPKAGKVVDLPALETTYRPLATLCRRAGVEYLAWHRLRHAFATVMLYEGGAKLHEVQAALGHASLATTGIYLDPHADGIAAASAKAFA